MRVSLLLLSLSAAGCFANRADLPEIDEKAKSMFVAVQTGDTEFWVVGRDVNASVEYPTILIDDEKRVDVYFFGCSLDELGLEQDQPFTVTTTDARSSSHVQPFKAFSTKVEDGEFGEWSESEPIDLKRYPPCPKSTKSWTIEPGTLAVDLETMWVLAEEDHFLLGSGLGKLYQINEGSDPSFDTLPDRRTLDMTKLGDTYYALVASGDLPTVQLVSMTDLRGNAINVGQPEDLSHQVRLRVRMTSDGDVEFFAGVPSGLRSRRGSLPWSEERRCTPDCISDLRGEVFLELSETGRPFFGTTHSGCLIEGDETIPLPAPPRSDNKCAAIGGLAYDEGRLVASIDTALYARMSNNWGHELATVSSTTTIEIASQSILMIDDHHLTELFPGGPFCNYLEPPNLGPTIQSILRVGRAVFAVEEDGKGVRIVRIETSPLNTCMP